MIRDIDTVLRNPVSVKQMAAQIKKACDLYCTFRLSEKELKEILLHFAGIHGKKLFYYDNALNPTISKIIGKKRLELVRLMLSGFQLKVL